MTRVHSTTSTTIGNGRIMASASSSTLQSFLTRGRATMRIGSDLIVQPAPCLFAPMSAHMPPSASSAAGEGNLSLRGRRILIVEDESLIAMLIGDAVEEAGGEVVGPCYTVAECMKAAQVEEIDAAVLDVDLAGRDVFPAAD